LSTSIRKVVIIGGGFGGLYATKALHGSTVQVTLIDRRNFHLFQPLLYQVATGGLSPADIASPLRAVFKKQRNVEVLLGEVTDIDFTNHLVFVANQRLPFAGRYAFPDCLPGFYGYSFICFIWWALRIAFWWLCNGPSIILHLIKAPV
jgi:NADH dehydrogenase